MSDSQEPYSPDELHEKMNEMMMGSSHSPRSSSGCFLCSFWFFIFIGIVAYSFFKSYGNPF
jgi:hypothetical protein